MPSPLEVLKSGAAGGRVERAAVRRDDYRPSGAKDDIPPGGIAGYKGTMEQVERTRRYLDRMRKIYSGAPYIENKEYYADDVLAFFVHCYHVRDWIITLNTLGLTREVVDQYIDSHEELRICADLCNGSKHCRLTRNMRTEGQPHIAVKQFISGGTDDALHTTQGEFTIVSGQHAHDALELAEACMKRWDEFVDKMRTGANTARRELTQ